jgi:hypothetical protein
MDFHGIFLGVSRSTIIRRRGEFGLDEIPAFSDITDQELDTMVDSIMKVCPNSGEVMVRGALLGRKLIRWRLVIHGEIDGYSRVINIFKMLFQQ